MVWVKLVIRGVGGKDSPHGGVSSLFVGGKEGKCADFSVSEWAGRGGE